MWEELSQKDCERMIFMIYEDLPRVPFNNTLRLNDLTDQELSEVFLEFGSRCCHEQKRLTGNMPTFNQFRGTNQWLFQERPMWTKIEGLL